MRFNTRINIGKGVNLNLSKSGASVNFGLPGMNVTVGNKGVTINRGIPGTYIRQRQKVLNADGSVVKRKKSGSSGWNVPLPVLIGQPTVDPIDYSETKKSKKETKKIRVRGENEPLEPYEIEDLDDFDTAMAQLEAKAQAAKPAMKPHEQVEDAEFEEVSSADEVIRFNSEREATINIARLAVPVTSEGDADVADAPSAIAGWLSGVTLPLEFAVDIGDFDADSGELFIDLDLPEIEDLPDETASVAKDGSLKVAEISDAQLREDYVRCIFGLGVFFASHFFGLAANLSTIVISAFTQRRNKAGDLVDDYIYSVKFTREGLAQIENLAETDPFDVAMSMENRCKLSRSNKFDVIEPYEP
ncbi:MAG: DUF4236 domain-containing protein [Actinomycetaceae bacterium]|nr:DUF4236 domain-containing protein [Actinomycetaceae bacterium]